MSLRQCPLATFFKRFKISRVTSRDYSQTHVLRHTRYPPCEGVYPLRATALSSLISPLEDKLFMLKLFFRVRSFLFASPLSSKTRIFLRHLGRVLVVSYDPRLYPPPCKFFFCNVRAPPHGSCWSYGASAETPLPFSSLCTAALLPVLHFFFFPLIASLPEVSCSFLFIRSPPLPRRFNYCVSFPQFTFFFRKRLFMSHGPVFAPPFRGNFFFSLMLVICRGLSSYA